MKRSPILIRSIEERALSPELTHGFLASDADLTPTLDTSLNLVIVVRRRADLIVNGAIPVERKIPVFVVIAGDDESPLRAVERAIREHSVQPDADTGVDGRTRHQRGPEAAVELLGTERLVGESPSMRDLKASIRNLSSTDTNVLISGETGTGKELVAQMIQENSRRRKAPFVCINCAAIPDSLLESELFGYERGAFTGAHCAQPGKLELADGGTVFLDEIGDMSQYAQAKILRAFESREIHRLGGNRPVRLNFRIIAATNQDLDSGNGVAGLRRDLYFRLNVGRIHIPALRERKADIPLLSDYYIRHFNAQFGREVRGLTNQTLNALLQYDWPGNVREFRNIVEAMFVNLRTSEVSLMDLPDPLRRQFSGDRTPGEQERLLCALSSTDWNKSKAARQLCWSRMTLYRRMAKYSLTGKGALSEPPGKQVCVAPKAIGTTV
jgi:transcriptional regulator with PAS, ATPase and Fis domain